MHRLCLRNSTTQNYRQQRNYYKNIFMAVFKILKNYKKYKCPSIGHLGNKLLEYILIVEFCAIINSNTTE